MFTTIVAWVVFVVTSLLNLIMLQELLKRGFNERYKTHLEIAALLGKGTRFAWERATVFAVLWFLSGWFLFG